MRTHWTCRAPPRSAPAARCSPRPTCRRRPARPAFACRRPQRTPPDVIDRRLPPPPGRRFEPGAGVIKGRLQYVAELLKEYVFENVRRVHFSERPSRRNCMYLFDTSEDSRAQFTRLRCSNCGIGATLTRCRPEHRNIAGTAPEHRNIAGTVRGVPICGVPSRNAPDIAA